MKKNIITVKDQIVIKSIPLLFILLLLTSVTNAQEQESKDTRVFSIKNDVSSLDLLDVDGQHSGSFRIRLTEAEELWLNNHKTIRVGGPKAFPPFHYFDESGNFQGMASDYIRLIFNRLNLTSDIQSNLPWTDVLLKAAEKEIDLISLSAISADREKYLLFTEPYLSFPLVIITRIDSPFVGGILDLHEKKVAFTEGNATYDWIMQDKIKVIPYFEKNPLDALKAVSLGNADVGIENLAAATYLIQKYGLANLKIAAPTPYGNYNLYMAVRKDWPELVSIINKTFSTITAQQHSEIQNKWLAVRYEHGISKTGVIKWILGSIGISAVILSVIILWNRKLSREIHERKQAEQALIESEEKLQIVFNCAPVGLILMNSKSVVLDCNQRLSSIFGARREEYVGLNLLDRIPEGLVRKSLVGAISAGGVHSYEGPYASILSGKQLYVSVSCEKIAPDLIIAIIVDITGRRQAEEVIKDSERLFRAVFMGSPVALAITTQEDGVWISANQTELEMFGYTREELIGKSVMDTNLWDDQNDRQRFVFALAENEEVKNEKTQLRRKDGSLFFASVSANSLTLKGVKHILFATEDITERLRAEETIKASLQEKDVLLREIHHRVKNNMQVISSLLSLQAARVENEQARHALIESQQRIIAMAMIHETIYGGQNLASIDLSSYLKNLVNHLQGLHNARANIRIALELDKINLDINQAVPCSLILNELISNAFKHAFPDGRKGTIQIKARQFHDSEVVLEVSDDGVGLPTDLNLSNPSTLGLRLVQGLLKKQLKGILDVTTEEGTTFTLRWQMFGNKGISE